MIESSNTLSRLETYSKMGWQILPLHSIRNGECSCGNPTCDRQGKHPRTPRSFYDATSDFDQIKAWWAKWPDANAGVRTGSALGAFVVDVDPRHGGDSSLQKMIDLHGSLPVTLCAKTGGGGQHIYFKYPKDTVIKNKVSFLPGLDVRGEGGYIIVEPSNHISGGAYEFIDLTTPVADAPPWLLELILEKPVHPIPHGHIQPGAFGEGIRNDSLTKSAGFLKRIGLNKEALESALHALNQSVCTPPLSPSEVKSIANSISNYSADKQPLERYTDLANAEFFAGLYKDQVLFCFEERQWYVWQDNRWVRDERGRIIFCVKNALRLLREQTLSMPDGDLKKSLTKHLNRTESERSIRALLKLSEPYLAISLQEFDSEPFLIAVKNAYIDLKTGRCVDPHSSARASKLIPITFDKSATCPLWLKFLNEIFANDREIISFVQRAVGYSLTASVSEQCFFICHGDGANGKSTFLEICRDLAGEYGRQADFLTFVYRENRSQTRNDIARLAGARFVGASESDRQHRLDEGVIKSLTGIDTISARMLYKEAIDFMPTFKIWLATNHRPKIEGSDNGIWRRVNLLPFGVTIPKEKQDRNLLAKLRNELAGILNWAVQGCLEWQKIGLAAPKAVMYENESYRASENTLARFFDDECIFGPELRVATSTLQSAYREWCMQNREIPKPWQDVTKELRNRSCNNESRTGVARMWTGITLRSISPTDISSFIGPKQK